ncbi:hypothetical protein TWF694_006129 [Orbilia ellipsospora]|uniref:Mitochondrial inner-membrane-bound regulator-domain-containing protein n=1 Tax=Orbilia ellipsospora TaxID=2528407 RepID=A0AAV9WSE7_9PEZI
MPLQCPAGPSSQIARSVLSYASQAASSRIPLRICSSCRVQLSSRGLATGFGHRHPSRPLRYQLLSDNLSKPHNHGYPHPAIATTPRATYATNSQFGLLSTPERSPARRLVVLGLPTPRRSMKLSEPLQVDKEDLDNLSQRLQTFEYQVPNDGVPNEILLFKPENLRVSRARFDQLFKDLNTAFLGPQIKEYLTQTKIDLAGGVNKMRKGDALNLVMREVWKVQVAEEIAAEEDLIREQTLKFRPLDLFFMMAENGEMLQKLATRNRTRIVLDGASNKITLMGTKASLEKVEEQLEAVPAMLVDRQVDISALQRVGDVNNNYIPSISRLTTVFLEVEGDKMKMHGAKPYGDSNIEDAQRLLFNSLDLHLRETYSLLGETRLAQSLTGALYPVSEKQTLAWLYRSRDWYRWRSVRSPLKYPHEALEDDLSEPEARPLINPVHGDHVSYTDIRTLLDSPLKAEAELVAKNVTYENNTQPTAIPSIPQNAKVETTYHAVLGQILHSSPSLPTDREYTSLNDLLSTDPSRVLCNSVPRLVDFLSSLTPVTYTYDFKILLKFSPSPWANPNNFELLPPVEMELHIKPETNEIVGLKISAVESKGITDVMMPRNSTDLRFIKRRLAKIDSKTAEVKTYINDAYLDVLGDDRLKGGEELVLNIPRWLMKGTKREEQWDIDDEGRLVEKMVAEEDVDGEEGTVPVTYYFTGLETRSSTVFNFEGAPLVYSKVEAGASGGSYDEVVLQCQKEQIEYLTPAEERVSDDNERKERYGEDEDIGYLLGEEPEKPEIEYVDEVIPVEEEAIQEGGEEEEDPNFISDQTFRHFVTVARRLVEAVESTTTDRERPKPKKL